MKLPPLFSGRGALGGGSALTAALVLALSTGAALGAGNPSPGLKFESPYLRAELAAGQPAFTWLSVDSLGKSKLAVNPLWPPAAPARPYRVRRRGQVAEYLEGSRTVWSFAFAPKQLTIRSRFVPAGGAEPFVLEFDPSICHATLLGRLSEEGKVALPALLHLPDLGTFRITSSLPVELGFDAVRNTPHDYVRVVFPAASARARVLEYRLEVVAIHPPVPGIAGDPRFDGFRRNFLNIFQLNPRFRVLANHAASDPCAFTLYLYADMAAQTPPLAPGLTALDILRQTLDRYLSGMKAYGMEGYVLPAFAEGYDHQTTADSYPSLVIAAAVYARNSGNREWLHRNYPLIKSWMESFAAWTRNGLLEHPLSGNAGSLRVVRKFRPSNWWDTIGFGHQDGYANALAYRAFREFAELARRDGHPADATESLERAQTLKAGYSKALFNPSTGVLAGWRSADGQLHDYYFTFVNGMAISYGLVTGTAADSILSRMLAKMREVGYARFDLGLPGNLIPIRREDYIPSEKRWGEPDQEDGSDGFQIYENGGATACFAYFFIQALYQTGKRAEADAILFPMLAAFEAGAFQGRGADGLTRDWKAWDGTPHGYEGFLVDNYMTLLAVVTGWGRGGAQTSR
jgi:hypothetical protein